MNYTPEDGFDPKPDAPKPSLDQIHEPQHYTKWTIEPIGFIMKNKLQFAEGNVIKYLMRFRDKNGLEDLMKARRYLDLLIEEEYGVKL